MSRRSKIAVIPGDGIGKEVMPEGIRVLEAAIKGSDVSLEFIHFDWSCEHFAKTGKMMPDDGIDQLSDLTRFIWGQWGSRASRITYRYGDYSFLFVEHSISTSTCGRLDCLKAFHAHW